MLGHIFSFLAGFAKLTPKTGNQSVLPVFQLVKMGLIPKHSTGKAILFFHAMCLFTAIWASKLSALQHLKAAKFRNYL
jgi:hypothetical protein